MVLCLSCYQQIPDRGSCGCDPYPDRGASKSSIGELQDVLRTVAEDLEAVDASTADAVTLDTDEDLGTRVQELLRDSERLIGQMRETAAKTFISEDEAADMELLLSSLRQRLRSAMEELHRENGSTQRTVAAGSTYEQDEEEALRNEPCPCGSGAKYKRCHGAPSGRDRARRRGVQT